MMDWGPNYELHLRLSKILELVPVVWLSRSAGNVGVAPRHQQLGRGRISLAQQSGPLADCRRTTRQQHEDQEPAHDLEFGRHKAPPGYVAPFLLALEHARTGGKVVGQMEYRQSTRLGTAQHWLWASFPNRGRNSLACRSRRDGVG